MFGEALLKENMTKMDSLVSIDTSEYIRAIFPETALLSKEEPCMRGKATDIQSCSPFALR